MGKYVLFDTGIRRLDSKEKGIFYRYPGTDEVVRSEKVLERIEGLNMPPAWEDVRIAQSPPPRCRR
jgi:DNA topoisomerase IB